MTRLDVLLSAAHTIGCNVGSTIQFGGTAADIAQTSLCQRLSEETWLGISQNISKLTQTPCRGVDRIGPHYGAAASDSVALRVAFESASPVTVVPRKHAGFVSESFGFSFFAPLHKSSRLARLGPEPRLSPHS
jgi:hypothetical protein